MARLENAMQVSMLDAKNKLSRLVAAAEQGEEVILVRDGVRVAKIVKYEKSKVKPPGAWKGRVRISKDWNTAETNAMIEGLFYGEAQRTTRRHRAAKRTAKKSLPKK